MMASVGETTEHASNASLYPGEVLDTIAGFPTIYHYKAPSSTESQQSPKPLIVFVTGGLHLARVVYGGHHGSKPQNFLSHWLSQLGFGVLALSYPVETKSEIMPLTAASFRIPDWGRQAATTTKMVLDQNGIANRSVVLISWSMGGRMVVPYNIAAKELGLDVKQYISFAATPGLSSIRPLPPGIVCTPSGYFEVPPHLDAFSKQLDEMEGMNGNQEAIPRDVYFGDYVAATPVNLIGLGLKYDGTGSFVRDEKPHEDDSRVLDIANWPMITAMYPSSILDASHALADKASWSFLLTYKLEQIIGKGGIQSAGNASKWKQLLDLMHSAPDRLCLPVPGNHFFFVGENSARDIANRVSRLIDDAVRFQAELAEITQQ